MHLHRSVAELTQPNGTVPSKEASQALQVTLALIYCDLLFFTTIVDT